MDKYQRFIETTLPMIVGYGMAVVSVTALFGFGWGILGMIIFAIVDVALHKENKFVPLNINYQGKFFPTLTQLMSYVKKQSINIFVQKVKEDIEKNQSEDGKCTINLDILQEIIYKRAEEK